MNEFIEWINSKINRMMDNEENTLCIQEQFEVIFFRKKKNMFGENLVDDPINDVEQKFTIKVYNLLCEEYGY